MTYSFEVEWSTHDDVKAGRTVVGTAYVSVVADDEVAASLLAAQMVGSHRALVTAVRKVECVHPKTDYRAPSTLGGR